MAEVLPVHIQTEGKPFYNSSGLRRSRPSQPSLYIPSKTATPSRVRKHESRTNETGPLSHKHRSLSSPSKLQNTGKSERASSSSPSPSPSPSPSKSKSSGGSTHVDLGGSSSMETLFSSYTPLPAKIEDEEHEAPPSSPQNASPSPEEPRSRLTVLRTRSYVLVKAEDDTAVKQEPSRHVDYLSHEWKEEDIWSSWRHIVSHRKVYGEKSRLENASWRTWAKQKNKLKTVHPQNLNWLKDCDVTWLYGPLQTAGSYRISEQISESTSNLSKNNSFLNKKPILKKRSVSELMLQKSLSSSSLIQQAAAVVQAQRSPYSNMSRRASDYMTDTFSSRATSRDGTDYFSSRSTSGFQSPAPEQAERRHIRFDNKVEQCIAVEIKDGDYEDDDVIIEENMDSSEDGIVMKRRSKRRRSKPDMPRRSSTSDSKIIAKLPSTTLKDRVEPPGHDPQSHSLGSSPMWKPRLSPSPSIETLRPPNPSKNFLIEEEDEDEDEDDPYRGGEVSWTRGILQEEPLEIDLTDDNSLKAAYEEERLKGLRRTESGMFMPVEEDADAELGGIVGRVLDTVNTARDIAHVIWNVGWRR